MEPTLREGDRLLVLYGARPRLGRLALVRLPQDAAGQARPTAVKRVIARVSDGWWVERDSATEGVDSWTLGAVASRDMLAVVLCRLPARRGARQGRGVR